MAGTRAKVRDIDSKEIPEGKGLGEERIWEGRVITKEGEAYYSFCQNDMASTPKAQAFSQR